MTTKLKSSNLATAQSIDSVTLTGTPIAPTATTGTNTTQIATTAFVLANGTPLSATIPVINGTALAGTETAASHADHVHPTDTSRAAVGQTMFIGSTAMAINRSTNPIALTGITSIDGSSASCTGNAASATTALTVTGGSTITGTGVTTATYGPELVTNGSFTGNATGWSLGTNWAYGTNNIILTNSGASGTVGQSINVVSGSVYQVNWDQSHSINANAQITPSIGSVSGSKCAIGTGVTTHSQLITANASGAVSFGFTVTDLTTTGTVTIDNVSVKLITPYAALMIYKGSAGDADPVEFRNPSGLLNIFIGRGAGKFNTTGYNNTFSGGYAGYYNTTGYNNTFSGVNAGFYNTTGYYNTFSGMNAGFSNTTGFWNTFSGMQAGYSNTTGYNNTFSGGYAGYYNTTGYANIVIGGLNSSGSFVPVFSTTTENDRVVIGSTSVTNAYIKVAWTVTSDARDKTNFTTIPHGLDFVSKLTPISYQFKTSRDSNETSGKVRYGFKAQDILALEGSNPVIIDNEDTDHLRYNGESLVPILVKAIQELKAEFDAYKLTHP